MNIFQATFYSRTHGSYKITQKYEGEMAHPLNSLYLEVFDLNHYFKTIKPHSALNKALLFKGKG